MPNGTAAQMASYPHKTGALAAGDEGPGGATQAVAGPAVNRAPELPETAAHADRRTWNLS